MGGGVEGGGGEGEGGGGGSGEGGGGEGEGGGGGEGEGGGGGGKGEGGEYWRHVVDVMVPPELQTWSPSPARAACTVDRCVVARGGAKACSAGAAARRSGVGWVPGGSARRCVGPRVTCLRCGTCRRGRRNSRSCSWSRSCPSRTNDRNLRRRVHPKSRSFRRKRSRRRSHCGQKGGGGAFSKRSARKAQARRQWQLTVRQGKEGRAHGAGRHRPAVVATRSQPPPIASAVYSARDRRFVRRVVTLVVRWEPPAAGFGEHHREVEEHRVSGSLHRPAGSDFEVTTCMGAWIGGAEA
eukprot:scaffold2052_cov60-Phaeocystis_antarctica.AAC.1